MTAREPPCRCRHSAARHEPEVGCFQCDCPRYVEQPPLRGPGSTAAARAAARQATADAIEAAKTKRTDVTEETRNA